MIGAIGNLSLVRRKVRLPNDFANHVELLLQTLG